MESRNHLPSLAHPSDMKDIRRSARPGTRLSVPPPQLHHFLVGHFGRERLMNDASGVPAVALKLTALIIATNDQKRDHRASADGD